MRTTLIIDDGLLERAAAGRGSAAPDRAMSRFALKPAVVFGYQSLVSAAVVLAVVVLTTQLGHERLRAQQASPSGLGALLDATGFVQLSSGEFMMGSNSGTAEERPVHQVRISKGFEMGRYEVTQAQWAAVMGTAHPSTDKAANEDPPDTNPSHFKGPTLPVENVSWSDVQRFLTKLNARDTPFVYRLPTEAEWEYAARAGTTEEVPRNLSEIAWFEGNSSGQTQPIGQKRPNAWGLYDMHGNVSEWVQDWFAVDYYEDGPRTDPTGPASGSYRIHRGCGWFASTEDCRPAFRTFNFPNDGYYNVGFRLLRTRK